MTYSESVLIIGAGAWGQTLAKICWKNRHDSISILGRNEKNKTLYKLQKENPMWPSEIHVHDDWEQALSTQPSIIIATPSAQCADILKKLGQIAYSQPVLCASKGMAHVEPPQFFHEFYLEVNPHYADQFAYLSGPNFAHEVAKEQPSLTQITAKNQALFSYWERLLSQPNFYIRYDEDMLGTAWCGVFKNITAFLSGALTGCGYGANTRTLLIQNACEQLQQIITSCGGDPKTAYSVAGMGDMILSGTSTFSRNFKAGEKLDSNSNNLAESLTNIPLAHQWLESHEQTHSSIIYLAFDLLEKPEKSHDLLKTWLNTQSAS